ncbi:MAG: aminoacyl-tRNA hydrolase, partial [Candidatus Omnitrophota bacterium]|nr:aminoacyl-tRNA hydrolase [Candidatus Omnitrophota bacterium]
MKLIVGLGNPGEEYKHTRHNIGAKVARILADSNRISLRRRRYSSHFGEGKIHGEEVIIILPLTYMNLSGEAASAVMNDKEILPSDLLVVCDDADLGLGEIRIRSSGSDGGHRGLHSIIAELGTSSFNRLRIGIGRAKGRLPDGQEPASGGSLKDHVLRPFSKDEAAMVKEVEERAAEAVSYWLKNGID